MVETDCDGASSETHELCDAVKRAEYEELINKVNRCNKNIRTVMGSLKNIENKLNINKENVAPDGEPPPKKTLGRPAGTWDDKREQYYHMIKNGKISQPKPATLEYYKIVEINGEYMLTATTPKKE